MATIARPTMTFGFHSDSVKNSFLPSPDNGLNTAELGNILLVMSFLRSRNGKDAENYVHAVSFEIELLQTPATVNVVESNVARLLFHSVAKHSPDPKNVLLKLRLADLGEANPDSRIVQRQQTSTPA